MAVSDEFLEYMLDQLRLLGKVTARRMFGGAGLYYNGRMFGLVSDDVPYLKVDDSNRQDFVDEGSSPFIPFPEKAQAMSYYEIPAEVLEESALLARWAERSLDIARKKK